MLQYLQVCGYCRFVKFLLICTNNYIAYTFSNCQLFQKLVAIFFYFFAADCSKSLFIKHHVFRRIHEK
jgi:hypothetical protein